MLTLLLIGVLTWAFDVQSVKAEPTTIIVPDDYPTIQEAINNANEGDTIYVKVGTYYENVVVNKSLSLVGENRSTTIIDANGTLGTAVIITANDVTLSQFTIRNAGALGQPAPGIVIRNCNDTSITNNVISNNREGIVDIGASRHYIADNVIINNKFGIGIGGLNNILSNNSIINNDLGGVFLSDAETTIINGNNVTNNGYVGINVNNCWNTTIGENTVANNEDGMRLIHSGLRLGYPAAVSKLRQNNMTGNKFNLLIWGNTLKDYILDIDTSNTVNGKPVYYLINRHNLIIDSSTFPDPGYLGIINSTNVKVKDLRITNNGEGVLFVDTVNSKIQNVTVSNNWWGIYLLQSSHREISNNTVTGNTASKNIDGIYLDKSSNNIISDNMVLGNNRFGIRLEVASNNTITNNTISNNKYGVYLWYMSNGNAIYHNNFINNTKHARSYKSANKWDDGYPSGGNYWSDYTDVDEKSGPDQDLLGSDGLWDHPYEIDADNIDNYPLVEPWSPRPPTPLEVLEELIETIETWNLRKGTENSLTSKLEGALHLLDMGKGNGAVHKLMAFIRQVEALEDKKLTDEQADHLIEEAQRIIDLIKG